MRLLITLLSAFFVSTAAFAETFAIVGVNVIPMNEEKVLRDRTVIVVDGTIREIAKRARAKVPAGAKRVDGKGHFLIPGLTDAHVHLFTAPELALYLANGVTTVFNLNGAPAHLNWRKQIRDGAMIGPEIYSAGPTFMKAHSAADAVKLVDEQAAAGYDAVKIYNDVSRDEYDALIAEAKAKNLLLIGHVAREIGVEKTLRAGQSIAHMEEFVYTWFNPKGDHEFTSIVFDESKIPALAKATAASGIAIVPTISTFRDIISQATELETYLKNPELAYLAPRLRATLEPGMNRYDNRYSPESLKQLQAALPFQRKLVRAMHQAGVPLLAGTDATSIGPVAGFSIHEELLELVKSGLTPHQALQTATINAARYLRRANEYGTIERGKRADFILLSADPLADVRNTRKIAGVMTHGRWLDAADLARMIEDVPSAYSRDVKRFAAELRSDPRAAEKALAANDPIGLVGAAALNEVSSSMTAAELHEFLSRLERLDPGAALVGEESLNELGYALLMGGKGEEAIEVFALNAGKHPKSANALDSLAEAYFRTDRTAKAVELYGKALELDEKYPNAEFARKFVAEHRSEPAH